MKPKALLTALSLVLGTAALASQILAQVPNVKLDRTVLPIPEPNYRTARYSMPATPRPRRLPGEGAEARRTC